MNTTPSQRLGFLHHIRLVPLFACILGGILVLFALSSALAGYFLWQADRDQRDVTAEIEIRTGLANSSDFLRSARINMIQAGAASRIAEMEAMKRNIAQAESEIKQSQQGYRAYQNRPVKTPADEALDTELNQRFQAYITGMQPMLKYAKNGMFEAIINHESEQIRPLDNAYTDILNKAVKIRSTRANQLAELAHQRTRLGGMFMIGAFVLALVMTLITFMVLRRIVIRPLQHAAQRIEKIASGDLTMKDEPAGRNEIGRLSRHLQQMQHSLGMTVGTVRQGAEEIYRGTSEISAGNADLSSDPRSINLTDSLIKPSISFAAWALRLASVRTSLATTANPRPCSPARAASTAAFSARIFVWKAILLMTAVISEIFFELVEIAPIVFTTPETVCPPSLALIEASCASLLA
jgi:methyl-accepting chemotaxis protein III, ribose and galactose sensor receptor